MQKVLIFCGSKQSHKSTSAKYITAHRMKEAGDLKWFEIDNDGDLLVSTGNVDSKGNIIEGKGVLDLNRLDSEFAKYAVYKIWPHAKIYHFAEELKQAAINIFGLDPKLLYGTDEDKNQKTHIKWKNIWSFLTPGQAIEIAERYNFGIECGPPNDLYLTYREFLQEFGTTICRAIDGDCWVNATWRKIEAEGWPFCIIDDCRFENEVHVSRNKGAHLCLLTHQPFKDSHASEQIHNLPRKLFHTVIDNANMNFEEKNIELVKLLDKAGWNTGEIS